MLYKFKSKNAGNISVTAGLGLRLDHASIRSKSAANGGEITLKAGTLITLEQSEINASADNIGGNIIIDPPLVVLRGTSVTANSDRADAGFIRIVADSFLQSDSVVRATTPNKTAFQGRVEVTAPDSDLAGCLVPLVGVFLHADSRLIEECATQSLGVRSSFNIRARGGVSFSP